MKKEILTTEKDKRGTITYFNLDGDIHNPHGPAIVWANGSKAYCIDGKLHNPNGPAVDFADGDKEYWINDQNLTESEFKTWQKQQTAKL